jgi:hypothetical protein
MDPDMKKDLAKPYYEQVIKILEPTPDKGKKELMESYIYLAINNLYKYDDAQKNKPKEAQQYKDNSKSFCDKVLSLDPNNEQIKKVQEYFSK